MVKIPTQEELREFMDLERYSAVEAIATCSESEEMEGFCEELEGYLKFVRVDNLDYIKISPMQEFFEEYEGDPLFMMAMHAGRRVSLAMGHEDYPHVPRTLLVPNEHPIYEGRDRHWVRDQVLFTILYEDCIVDPSEPDEDACEQFARGELESVKDDYFESI